MKGTAEYCYEIEEKLRPNDHIGWNIMQGGGKPPLTDWTGRKHTEKSRRRMKESHQGQHLGSANPMFGRNQPHLITLNKSRKGLPGLNRGVKRPDLADMNRCRI